MSPPVVPTPPTLALMPERAPPAPPEPLLLLPPVPPLIELQAELERLMQRVGLEPEGRKFMPHVTLARLRDSSSLQVADYLSARGPVRVAPFPVSRFVLFSSKASVGGGPYVVEAAYPLRNPSPRSGEGGDARETGRSRVGSFGAWAFFGATKTSGTIPCCRIRLIQLRHRQTLLLISTRS